MAIPLHLRLLLAGLIGVVCQASAGGDIYEQLLMEDLYKRLADIDVDPYYEDVVKPDWDDVIPLDSRDNSQAELRDHEYLEHGSNSEGWQKISGGAGEGQQHLTPEGTQNNTMEVKTDEALPYYCQPPNPCPKGMTPDKDNCQNNIDDSAEAQKKWITEQQRRKLCPCDTEHMFDCPTEADQGATANTEEETRDAMNILDSFLDDKYEAENPYAQGEKNEFVVAKKSPRVERSVNVAADLKDSRANINNPYLQGDKLRIVAKKGMQYQRQ